MSGNGSLYTFCAMQPESTVVLCALQEKKEKGELSKREEKQLYFLRERQAEGHIWLMPALVFAAANQSLCRDFFLRAADEQKRGWQEAGTAWMRHYPAFLNRIGWQERQQAIHAAGFFLSVRENDRESMMALRRFLSECWSFLWCRVKQEEELGIGQWEELLMPWEDSPAMECAMAAVFLVMANLQKKPVTDIDQLWRPLRKLKEFSENCVRKPETPRKRRGLAVREEEGGWRVGGEAGTSDGRKANGALNPSAGRKTDGTSGKLTGRQLTQTPQQQERLEWLFTHFKNPQRLAYLKEKGRISSEWMDTLFNVMEKAGLPRSACESMQIGGDEVLKLLDCFTDRASERQYITFLLLYTVSRELVKAGQMAAAGQDGLPEKL